MAVDRGPLRIGEFARRVGVNPELLRAWERRYGLLRPIRSPGGFRLYTAEDAERVSRMRRALGDGVSAAEAARMALEDSRPSDGRLDDAATRLHTAIRTYDDATANAVLDESLGAFGTDAVLREVILPTLARVGDEWEQGALDVGQEHFASNLIRERLLALARLWGRGRGPLALLACVQGERHDISLIAFGVVLRSHGWRILFLGADTPSATLVSATASTDPALAVVTSFDPTLLEAEVPALQQLAKTVPLALAGPGVSDAVALRIGARRLDGDLVAAAGEIAAAVSHV